MKTKIEYEKMEERRLFNDFAIRDGIFGKYYIPYYHTSTYEGCLSKIRTKGYEEYVSTINSNSNCCGDAKDQASSELLAKQASAPEVSARTALAQSQLQKAQQTNESTKSPINPKLLAKVSKETAKEVAKEI